jgi:hypothetical protein
VQEKLPALAPTPKFSRTNIRWDMDPPFQAFWGKSEALGAEAANAASFQAQNKRLHIRKLLRL